MPGSKESIGESQAFANDLFTLSICSTFDKEAARRLQQENREFGPVFRVASQCEGMRQDLFTPWPGPRIGDVLF